MRDGRRQVSWQNLAVCGMSHSGDVYGQAFSGGDQARETITLDARRLLYGYPDVTVSWDEDPTYPLRQWFADLSEAEQAAAEQLGWDVASWDEGGRALGAALAAAEAGKLAETPSGNLVVPPDLVAAADGLQPGGDAPRSVSWAMLNGLADSSLLDAATALGFDEARWEIERQARASPGATLSFQQKLAAIPARLLCKSPRDSNQLRSTTVNNSKGRQRRPLG